MHVELKNITRKYVGSQNPVLDNITLSIAEGSTLAIIGPSGSGKSTLLNLLGTLDLPTLGEVLLAGTATSSMKQEDLVKMRNSRIGFIFQTHLLLPQLTTLENVLLPVVPQEKEQRKAAPERAIQLLNIVGLSDKLNRYPAELSVGECQRVAVVRALINKPELLLADEPTGSLDHDSAERLIDMLLELKQHQDFTLVAVTHSEGLAKRMDRTYKLINGKISVY
jgi:lipoprotein-releasing system ATP-binding protein